MADQSSTCSSVWSRLRERTNRGSTANSHSARRLPRRLLALGAALVVGVTGASGGRRDTSLAALSIDGGVVTPAAAAVGVQGAGTLRTVVLTVADATPGKRRAVRIYTPDVADPGALPVLYLLHGLPGSSADLCSRFVAAELDAVFRSGIRPFMLVCPDGASASVSDDEWADTVDGRTTLETFVTGQVREAVEGDHPRLAAMRAIGGFSMGGFGAASLGLRHPQLYSQVVSLAGYFHLDDPDAVFGSTQSARSAHDPTRLVAAASGQRWFLAQAAGDTLALTAHDSQRFAPLLRTAGADVTLTISPGDHGVTWAARQLIAAARFLGDGWGEP